eukprot:7886115-Pyramimonas_sp.AAC.1
MMRIGAFFIDNNQNVIYKFPLSMNCARSPQAVVFLIRRNLTLESNKRAWGGQTTLPSEHNKCAKATLQEHKEKGPQHERHPAAAGKREGREA